MSVVMTNAYFDQVPAADTLLYTCPANTTARVIKAVVTNDTTTVETLTLHHGTAGADTLLMNAKSIGNKESYACQDELVGVVIEAGETLRGEASAATQLTLRIDVVEIV